MSFFVQFISAVFPFRSNKSEDWHYWCGVTVSVFLDLAALTAFCPKVSAWRVRIAYVRKGIAVNHANT